MIKKQLFLTINNCYNVKSQQKILYSHISENSQTGAQNMEHITIDKLKAKVLNYCEIPKSSKEIREYVGLSSKTYVADSIIKPLLKAGMLEYKNKRSINTRNQKYITVKK